MQDPEITQDIQTDFLWEEKRMEKSESILYEQFKNGEVLLDDLVDGQKVRFLILLRAEQKTLKALDEEIMSDLEDNDDFEKAECEGITVRKKTRRSIYLLPNVDLQKIRKLYPDITTLQNVLHPEKLSDKVREYLKAQPEAVEEVIDVDARKLHEVTKDYTKQSLTTYIEVKGL